MTEKVDAVTLTEVIDRCLDYSMDGRFTQAQRTKFLALAKRLRGSLLNLLSARFAKDTAELEQANGDLAAVNKRLKKQADTLDKAAQTLADLTKLVGALDKLIGVAGMFL
jgi:septal ring factor EnvC (AmiA/AmiB activator)